MSASQNKGWDGEQLSVIEAGYRERLLVEAGPGTGKTAVACARVASLVSNEGISASNVWMISFTRTAVSEIRSRLQEYVGEDAFSVKVATVDSHAWAIHSGYDPGAKLTGTYEENIDKVIDLIRSDSEVQEELGYVEHLVVDEAQDLVGNRAKLTGELISHLNQECGITVFADSAQAIYGFSEDDSETELDGFRTLVDELKDSEQGFRMRALRKIYRTSSSGLLQIFSDVRQSVLAGIGAPEGLFGQTRKNIESNADRTGLTTRELGIDEVPPNSFVLFRSRAEALRNSQFCKRPHSLRLSGFGPHLPPWISICLRDHTDPAISEEVFLSLWAERVEQVAVPDYGPDKAWERLLRVGGNRDGSVDLKTLRARLSYSNPPVDLCRADFGLPGPTIGTIHASKGREADHVTMLVPRREAFDSPEGEAEETRVLFVGATRAREELRVGDAAVYSGKKLDGGRAYKPGRKGTMVEIGHPGDLSDEGIAGRKNTVESEYLASQKYLEGHNSVIMDLELQIAPERDWRHRIVVPTAGLCIGLMSDAFKKDLWDIAERTGENLRPPGVIKHVRALGARTIVVGEDSPELETLFPAAARTGFFLAPMIAAFTNVYFKRKSSRVY